ncbi:sugar transferase [Psychromicrobium lacuslunae]|uniref:sugar transferase n=1 Tax=Psychromicrobium lacuslunae TaxID=1618207 RepID=UPI00069749A5|nr:sugar transferase [Psychromicrobium lacuslunae]
MTQLDERRNTSHAPARTLRHERNSSSLGQRIPATALAAKRQRHSARFIELLVVLDLGIILAVMLGSLVWPFADAQQFWLTAAAVLAWLIALTAIKGFSKERVGLPRPLLSVWACSLVLAGANLINLFENRDIVLHRAMITVLVITGLDILGRLILKQFRSNHVISVVDEKQHASSGSDSRREVHPFVLTEELRSNPDELLRKLSNYIRFTKATAVELPVGLNISQELINMLSWELRKKHVAIRMVLGGQTISASRMRARSEGSKTIIEIDAPYQHLGTRVGKRVMDIVGSGLLIIAFSPLFLVLAIIVKLSSPGPVMYRQERIGIDERPFNILKFRSMVVGADAQLQALLKAQGSSDKPLFKVDSDPRITRIGGVMRRLSLDELPQLFNVFGGSMSLVGPRPQRPAEVALYDQAAKQRLGVLPGMTGMWQISGRSRLSWEQAIALDRYYAQNWSLSQDLKILARTVSAVVRGDGAV